MKERARSLRKVQTEAEKMLWNALRSRRFLNYKFRRQRLIGFYIVDFICLKQNLIIEIDGSQHLDNQNYDLRRTRFLESCGFRVLRFWNNQIFHRLNDVLNNIYLALSTPPHPALRATFSRNREKVKIKYRSFYEKQ